MVAVSVEEARPATGELGARRARVEDARLLIGHGAYVGDVRLPRMAHVAFVRSWAAHGRLVAVDAARARALPGVIAVLTARDLPPVPPLTDGNWIPNLVKTPQPVLAVDRVRFVGEPVAAVVACDRYVAEDAADLVEVDIEILPAVTRPGAPPDEHVPLFDDIPDDVIYDEEASFGDPAGARGRATHVFTRHLDAARVTAAPMEGRGAVARYDPGARRLEVWASTQSPHLLRRRIAVATGLHENQVRVVMHDVGGGFGQKIAAHPEELATAMCAIAVGRPVSWVEDRRENLLAAPQARGQAITLSLATDDDGRFLALEAHVVGDAGAYSFNSASALIEAYLAARGMPGVYAIGDYQYRVTVQVTNKSPIAPYRGVGFAVGQAVRELLIDDAAAQLGIDRFELRRRNMIGPETFPYESCTGLRYDSGSFQESLQSVEEMLEEAVRRVDVPEGRVVGVGVSPYVEPGGWGTEGMMEIGWHSFPSNDAARVSLDPGGRVTVEVGTPSQGQGIETTLAQVAADVLGVRFDDVVVHFGDTTTAPISLAGTRASRVAVVSGGAVGLAAGDLRDKVLRIAAAMLESDESELEVRDGAIRRRGGDGQQPALTVADVVGASLRETSLRQVDPEPSFSATRFYDPAASYSNACVGAVVDVDVETGLVRVQRLVAAEDCGTVINPTIVEGQFAGAAAQGLGFALFERLLYDKDTGEAQTTSFMDYLLPTCEDVPGIDVRHLSSPAPHTWRGIKGVGESGAIGVPAAIAAAVADALRRAGAARGPGAIPIRAEDVFALLHEELLYEETAGEA